MQSKIKKIVITIVVLCVIGIPVGKHWYNNHAIQFKDENMKKVIANLCYKSYNEDTKITPEDMKKVVNLDIGYTGYYDTLEDLKWCTELKKLYIDMGVYESSEAAYRIAQGEVPEEVTEEKVKQYEKELGKTLPKLRNLKEIYIASDEGCNWESLNFLKGCNQIEKISMYHFNVTDYSVLKQCKSLKRIVFFGCPISKADDLIGLENLEWIGVSGTPLAEDKEEWNKLKEAYPNAEYK